ncbi:MAG: zinc-binding dehydrogenase [Acidimicrobiales bacterium]
MEAIRQYEFGGPQTLRLETMDDLVPGTGEVRIAVAFAGVHLIDTRIRQGTFFGVGPRPSLPMTPGREVAGVVAAVGSGVDSSWIGLPVVAHLGDANGGYASAAVARADDVYCLPDGTDLAAAIAMVGTGRTALGILEVAQVRREDVVVLTAAAGGIGALLIQAARRAGAFVVGTAGGASKAEVVRRLGADLAVDYREASWQERVRDELVGRRVSLGLDGVGGAAGRAVLELLALGGRMVMYGFASGEAIPLTVGDLFTRGISVTSGIGARVAARPGGLRPLAERALAELAGGRLMPLVHPPFALADAAAAHRALEGRETTGKVVLVPSRMRPATPTSEG